MGPNEFELWSSEDKTPFFCAFIRPKKKRYKQSVFHQRKNQVGNIELRQEVGLGYKQEIGKY